MFGSCTLCRKPIENSYISDPNTDRRFHLPCLLDYLKFTFKKGDQREALPSVLPTDAPLSREVDSRRGG